MRNNSPFRATMLAATCVVLATITHAETQRPFQQEVADIQDARDRGLAACDAIERQRYAQLGTVISNGIITDRNGLISLLVDTETPEAALASMSDQDLISAALLWAIGGSGTCQGEVYRQEGEAYEAISEILSDNITALRAETASLQDLLAVLEQLEALADEDASILLQIEELRQSTAEAQQSTAELSAQIECIWHNITTGNTEPDCSDPTVFGEFLER